MNHVMLMTGLELNKEAEKLEEDGLTHQTSHRLLCIYCEIEMRYKPNAKRIVEDNINGDLLSSNRKYLYDRWEPSFIQKGEKVPDLFIKSCPPRGKSQWGKY